MLNGHNSHVMAFGGQSGNKSPPEQAAVHTHPLDDIEDGSKGMSRANSASSKGMSGANSASAQGTDSAAATASKDAAPSVQRSLSRRL